MHTLRTAVLSAGALALLAVAACGAPGRSSGSSPGGSGPVKIAVVDAQSGQNADLGQWEYRGAKLAVDQLNKAGGINGRRIQLDLFDDQGDPTVSANLASKIHSKGYIAMIGTSESGDTVAMAPILASAGIPAITSGQSTQITALHNPFIFLNGPTSTTYDGTLEKYLISTKHYTKIAMITNNGSYGAGERTNFKAALQQAGLSPTTDQVVTTSQTDFSAALTAIRQSNPQVVFIGSEEIEAGLIVKQARALGITVPFAGGAPQGTPTFASSAGAANVEGTVVSSPYLSNDTSAASKSFATAYQAEFKTAPELHGAKAYDGTEILLTALKNSGVATGRKLADAIRAVHRDGLLGDFQFDAVGVGIFATKIGVITNGQVTPIN
jgi:branched-chain amino acid transport system substrate-binding protein